MHLGYNTFKGAGHVALTGVYPTTEATISADGLLVVGNFSQSTAGRISCGARPKYLIGLERDSEKNTNPGNRHAGQEAAGHFATNTHCHARIGAG